MAKRRRQRRKAQRPVSIQTTQPTISEAPPVLTDKVEDDKEEQPEHIPVWKQWTWWLFASVILVAIGITARDYNL